MTKRKGTTAPVELIEKQHLENKETNPTAWCDKGETNIKYYKAKNTSNNRGGKQGKRK